ncbi:organic solvent tolerance protein OstA [Rhodopirellula sp. JC740]|uniref:Organic solvent tolerance protein OstA n=1 Tax=Rhodopirellula halodulae TaxID=2894198 RepID=A0ABS8NCJ1_9BACT|nr:organic solvent tolerance protein OstA [Rhodopirellula sp. JC740]
MAEFRAALNPLTVGGCFGDRLRVLHLVALLWMIGCSTCVFAQTSVNEGSVYEVTDVSQTMQLHGDVVHRWKDDHREFSWLRGNVQLSFQDNRYQADSIFIVLEGSQGDLTARLLMDRVKLGPGQHTEQPIVQTVKLSSVPILRADTYRGRTSIPDGWWARMGIPNDQPVEKKQTDGSSVTTSGEIAPVQYIEPVQYMEPVMGQPNLPSGGLVLDPPVISSEPPPIQSFQPPIMETPPPSVITPEGATTGGVPFIVGGGTRSIEVFSRGANTPAELQYINRPGTNESVVIARGGVTVLVRDVSARLPGGEITPLGTVSLSANRIVAWLPRLSDVFQGTQDFQSSEGELYLEGDIVFRQGDRIIYAEAMYYNVTREVGMVLDAETIASIPQYEGTVRLKADVMRQISRGNFQAIDAAVTSSRLGVPRYWLQSSQLELTQRPIVRPDPITGQPITDSEPIVSSGGNFVYLGGVPVLAWPRFTTPLRKPTFYLTGADVRNDDIFGTQVLLEWDFFQLLGISNPPSGVETILLTDYLSDRGPAVGTRTTYALPSLFGIGGPVSGTYDSYLIKDSGLDVLGQGRRDLVPEEEYRGRATLRHRHYLPGDWEFIAEIGYLSDRNFLEQYFESEWDQDADHRTGLRFRKYAGSQMLDVAANFQVNDFFMETEELPTIEHYALGGSILGDLLTWSMHNEVGYKHLQVAEKPSDPVIAANTFTLPGELDREGVVTRTRQEVSMPLDLGPLKFIPFATGEAAHYGEGADGDDVTRLWGGGGIRLNLPMSRVDPTIQSSLLNIRGLAHKIDWSAEYFYADSDTNMDELPYYDPLDDNAQEEFRRVFIGTNYGGVLPPQYDPMNYAFRQGIQRSVTSPSDTVVDDLQQLRLGMKHRFQTKRGLPGRERIVDLLRFDMETILFPKEDRDNFGETLGPTMYDAQYNIGDRFTLLSDGYIDFFDGGLRSISAGFRTSRPGLGDLYVGVLSMEGPISSTVLRTSLDYRLNHKWIVSAGNVYDFGETGNVGQTLGLTRVGESFLIQLAANVDAGRDNTSIGFMIEPRFLPSTRLGRLGGQLIPPPGVEGLE